MDSQSYQLVREIKLAVYRASNYGDQVRIWMNERTPAVIQYEMLGEMSAVETETLKGAIVAKSTALGMQVKQNIRPKTSPASEASVLQTL